MQNTELEFQDPSVTHNGVSKVERYKWRTGSTVGVFEWIDKNALNLTAPYQRDQASQESKIKRIAADFSWPAFGCACVARSADGALNVFDGAGRVSAARRRSDVSLVPCMVYDMGSTEEEALAFIEANTGRKPVNAVAKHNAHREAKDKTALVVDELVTQIGRSISTTSGPNTVRCIALLRRHVVADEARIRRVWPLIGRICKGFVLNERILDGLVYIDRHLSDARLVTDPRWERRIMQVGYEALLNGANRAAAYYAKGGASVWADGMLGAINKGVQEQNRLTLDKPVAGSPE